MSLQNFTYSNHKNTITKKYLVPQRIVTADNAENSEFLLEDTHRQSGLNMLEYCVLHKGGYVVLDFGSELQGGIDLSVVSVVQTNAATPGSPADKYGYVRIVFGESVSEAMSSIGDEKNALNDHSVRDMTVQTCSMSTMRYGNTGFRFVKLEAVDKDIIIS
ncbi:MAG: hypothetical protein IJ365_03350, partial [Clostridia bacterium]|nr:hypothetical protein [Clostridia bacterium]